MKVSAKEEIARIADMASTAKNSQELRALIVVFQTTLSRIESEVGIGVMIESSLKPVPPTNQLLQKKSRALNPDISVAENHSVKIQKKRANRP